MSEDETGDADEAPDQAYRLLPVRDLKAGVDVSVMVVKACTRRRRGRTTVARPVERVSC